MKFFFVIFWFISSFISFADNDFCKKYPRLTPCVCETTKNELSRATTVFFSFLEVVAKIKVNPISVDMATLQYIVSESGRLSSKRFNDSLKYKCYKKTPQCEKAIKNLSKAISDLSKAAKSASKLSSAVYEYIVTKKEAENALKKANIAVDRANNYPIYTGRHLTARNEMVSKAAEIRQKAWTLLRTSKLKQEKITSLISEIEINTFKARHLSKYQNNFLNYCIEIYEKNLKEIINDKGIEKIEI